MGYYDSEGRWVENSLYHKLVAIDELHQRRILPLGGREKLVSEVVTSWQTTSPRDFSRKVLSGETSISKLYQDFQRGKLTEKEITFLEDCIGGLGVYDLESKFGASLTIGIAPLATVLLFHYVARNDISRRSFLKGLLAFSCTTAVTGASIIKLFDNDEGKNCAYLEKRAMKLDELLWDFHIQEKCDDKVY